MIDEAVIAKSCMSSLPQVLREKAEGHIRDQKYVFPWVTQSAKRFYHYARQLGNQELLEVDDALGPIEFHLSTQIEATGGDESFGRGFLDPSPRMEWFKRARERGANAVSVYK